MAHTITVTDTNTNTVVETILRARIPNHMEVRKNYGGLEHDGRYKIEVTHVREYLYLTEDIEGEAAA